MREMKQLVLLDADDGYLITVPEGQTGEIYHYGMSFKLCGAAG